jgi:hypothetical protein
MYPKGKTRRMDYTTVKGPNNTFQEIDLRMVYGNVNSNESHTTFDGKIKI